MVSSPTFGLRHAGQQPQGGGVQPDAPPEQQTARPVVLPLVDIILARREHSVDRHRVFLVGILLGHHAVAAGGQHGPRHDADGLTGFQRAAGRVSGIQGLRDGQHRRVLGGGPCQVGGAEGVAVQRGAVKGRLIQGGGHIRGQGTAQSLRQGQQLHAQGGEGGGYPGHSLLQGQIGEHTQYPLPKGQMG